MFGIGVGIRVGGRTPVGGSAYDADAQAFFDRVTTAGGTLTTTEKNATNQLVLDMKSAGIWSSMKAVYPMVGASVNLMSYTEDFSNAYWAKSGATITVNNITAPDGTMTADRVVYSTTNNYVYGASTLLGGIGTQSFYVKGTLGETLYADDGYTSASLITLTGDWQRVTFTTTRSAGQSHGILIGTYSGATARTIWLWGAQVDAAATATTYTPVLGSRTTEAAAACAQNLKSSSFTGTFTSGWTFASTGVTPNGTSAYMNTGLTPSTSLAQNSASMGIYSRTNVAAQYSDYGVYDGVGFLQRTMRANNTGGGYANATDQYTANTSSLGFFCLSRISSTNFSFYKNGSGTLFTSNSTGIPALNSWLGACNLFGTILEPSTRELAFHYISDGLTDTNVSNLTTAVQTFNQTLNRQVGAQIVSDADAQAYIDRVYTAGGTLTNTEANAVNQLVIDMKAAGIWTAMRAVYPMVGSSAASCAQNLKSSSFTGTFSSGWTFSSTGATPNGTSAYMDTTLNPSISLSQNSTHISYYTRTNVNSSTYEIGARSSFFLDLAIRYGGTTYGGVYASESQFSDSDSLGLYQSNRIVSTEQTVWKNGVKKVTGGLTSNAPMNLNVYLGAYNNSGSASNFSIKECAFSSIGDGLTDTQATALYNAVQTMNTTLSRNV